MNRICRADRVLISCRYYARYANGYTTIIGAINDTIQRNITHRETPKIFKITNYTREWVDTYKITPSGRVRKVTEAI